MENETSHISPVELQDLHWYAMRVTYRREMSMKQLLETASIECYIPMRQEVKTYRGKKARVMVPAVHNLLFVHCEKERLQKFKGRYPHLQYMTRREGGKSYPIVVPDKEMADFMTVTNTQNDNLLYLDVDDVQLSKGTLVRLHGGPLDGVEGLFIKIKGKRDRRVVIKVQNLLAVALATSWADSIEVLS